MPDYKLIKAFEEQAKNFLGVFFRALSINQLALFTVLTDALYPVMEGVYSLNAVSYLHLDKDAQKDVHSITGSGHIVIFTMSDRILCVQKLDNNYLYGFEIFPTRNVTPEWVHNLSLLVTYISTERKTRLKEILISNQSVGYNVKPISPILLEEKYETNFKQAKMIFA